MPFKHISIPPVRSKPETAVEVLRASTEHQINLFVQQVNQNANKFTNRVDAQNNQLTNLPNPAQGGDAVPLRYLVSTLGDIEKRLQVRIDRSIHPPSVTAARPFSVVFKAAINQNGTAVQGWSFGTDGPVAGTIAGTGTAPLRFAVSSFTNGQQVQDHFPLPIDWVPTTPINLDIWWLPATGTAGTWTAKLASIHSTGGDYRGNLFNSAGSAISTGTANVLQMNTVVNLDKTGINPGDEVFFQFGRSDTGTTAMGLLELRFQITRNM